MYVYFKVDVVFDIFVSRFTCTRRVLLEAK